MLSAVLGSPKTRIILHTRTIKTIIIVITRDTVTIITVTMIMNMVDTMVTVNITSLLVVVSVLHIYIMGESHYDDLSDRSSAVSRSLKLMTWNASGIMSSGSYLGRVLGQYDIDICGVSEHWFVQGL